MEFRPAELSDFGRYRDIMEACFGRRPTEAYFRWKYLENPAGKLIAYEALDQGRVAAFYGIIPELFSVRNERCLFYQSMDTMTHPDYRRLGLFVKLARLAYHELARRIPDYVLVGIPGTTSFSGFVQKLGWINPFHFKYLFIPRAVFQVVRRLRRSRGLEFVLVSAADASFRRYFEHREPDGDVIAPLLSAEFLQWRVLDNQSHAYTLVAVHEKGEMIGFVVYRPVDRGRVFIEMIDFRSPHYWKGPHLTATLWFLFENSRARSLYTWEPTQDRLAVAYKKAGLLWNPLGKGAFSYATPFIVRSAQMSFRGLDLRRRATYDLQPLVQD